MPTIQLNGDELDHDRVTATMLFPSNGHLREAYCTVRRVQREILNAKNDALSRVDAQTLRLLIEAPSYQQLKLWITESSKKAFVAGDILAAVYIMDRFEVAEPSMNKAIHIARMYAKTGTYGDGSRFNTSEPAILRCWGEYRNVAHFWAARRLNQAYPFTSERRSFSAQGFGTFLEVAAGIQRFGCGFTPKRAKPRVPIVDSKECWKLPASIAPRTLHSKRPPALMMKFLENYKAPKSV